MIEQRITFRDMCNGYIIPQRHIDMVEKMKSPKKVCGFCGHTFIAGEYARIIFTNYSKEDIHFGNPYACSDCDVMAARPGMEITESKESLEHARRNADMVMWEKWRQICTEFYHPKFTFLRRINRREL